MSAPPMLAETAAVDAVEVACVVGAWGVKGWFKVQCLGGNPEPLLASARWVIAPPEVLRLGAVYPPALQIVQARMHGNLVVAQAQGVADRSQAEALRGARVLVPRVHFAPPQAGEYYWVDLVGLSVVNRDGVDMGTVIGLLDTGPHSVLRLQRPASEALAADADAERLIPFVAAYIDDVSLPERLITVDWGLDY
jgi:16S rRNA processing protein RimM